MKRKLLPLYILTIFFILYTVFTVIVLEKEIEKLEYKISVLQGD